MGIQSSGKLAYWDILAEARGKEYAEKARAKRGAKETSKPPLAPEGR